MLKFFCYNFTDEKTTDEIIADINELIDRTKQYEREEEIMLFVFVPTISLEAVLKSFDRKYVKISAQGFSMNENPKVIGDVTLANLKKIGTDMVITGLADSRYYNGETNEQCRDKLEKILVNGFKSMLCVGETEEMAQNNTADSVIAEQVRTGCSKIPYEAHYRVGIIYRPLWAFGSNAQPSDEEYALARIKTIRKTAAEALPDFPIEMPVFYGGILAPNRAKALIESGTIDGVFVDSINVTVDDFVKLIESVC